MKKTLIFPLQIIHIAAKIGLVLFLIVSYFLRITDDMGNNTELAETLSFALMGVGVVCLGAFFMLPRISLKFAREGKNLTEKIARYRSFAIMRLAILELPTLLAIVIYLISGKGTFILVAIAMLILMSLYFPTIQRVTNELELDMQEQHELQQA